MLQLPLLSYPTTLFWVDDDEVFLKIARNRFNHSHYTQCVQCPKKAIDFFAKHEPQINPSNFLRGCVEDEYYDLPNHLPIDIDFDFIKQIQNNQHKQNDVPVMIVDYIMPEMTGIELCEQLIHIPTKKILLTGNADFQQAVNAFNKGIINCFICKDNADIDMELIQSINKLKNEYFVERTLPLRNHIESDYQLPHSDTSFFEFFEQLCNEMGIKEYYLADKNGGILMIDGSGKNSYLVIHTERTLDNFVELHQNINGTVFYLKSLMNRKKIPFFGIGKEAWDFDTNSWSTCFYTPNVLKGRENYYWAIINDL